VYALLKRLVLASLFVLLFVLLFNIPVFFSDLFPANLLIFVAPAYPLALCIEGGRKLMSGIISLGFEIFVSSLIWITYYWMRLGCSLSYPCWSVVYGMLESSVFALVGVITLAQGFKLSK
jgi:hypothetical protein